MTKVISIVTPKGEIGIPLTYVAENRANYYSDVDDYDYKSKEWFQEFNLTMEDDYEGIDWFVNNMDLDEVLPIAIMIDESIFCASNEEYNQDSVVIKDV